MSAEIIVNVMPDLDLAARVEVVGEQSAVTVIDSDRSVVEIEEHLLIELAPDHDSEITVEAVGDASTVVVSESGAPGLIEVVNPGPAGPGVPAGGGEGQVLRKKTADDFDSEWSDQVIVGSGDPPPAQGLVDGTLFVKIL